MKGKNKTLPRLLIIEFLKKNPDKRFTARDLCNGINIKKGEAVKSTVYRNIDKLCNEGRLVKYKEPNAKAMSYQYSEGHGSCKEHSHAQCSECGKLFHIDNEVFADAAKKMREQYGINMDFQKTLIIGICNECKEKKNRFKRP